MMKSKFKILLISDSPEYIQSILDKYPFNNNTPIVFETAETLSGGLNHIRNGGIEAIFLRLTQPAMSEALNSFREQAIRLPVIALIPVDEGCAGIRAIKEGAHNYLFENTTDIVSLTRSIRYAVESCKIAKELKTIMHKKPEHEESVMEVEKLKTLIEEYRLAAHELNQPLTALLGSVYLMRLDKGNQEKISRHIERIEESGKKISGIIKKIQALRHEKNNIYLGNASLMNPEQKLKSKVEITDNNFKNLNNLFRVVQERCNGSAL